MKIFKTLLFLLIILFAGNLSQADELQNVLNKVYDTGSKSAESIIGNLLPGPGETEVSIRSKNESKPTVSIMVIRPLKINEESLTFYQAQINRYQVLGEERESINYGIGNRFLSQDKSYFWGYNGFLDLDREKNSRLSFGAELKSSAFDFNSNYYVDVLGGGNTVNSNTERVLDGYDINLLGQVPYAPWANIAYTNYTWKAKKASDDSQGKIYSGEFYITNNVTLEFGYDDNNVNDTMDFLRFTYLNGGKERPTIEDGFSEVAFKNSDVREDMLTKVKRSNIINLEIATSGVVLARGTN